MTPTPWRVERGFGNSRIIAADGSIVAVDISQADAEAIVAALGVVEAARETHALREEAYNSYQDSQSSADEERIQSAHFSKADEIEARISAALAAYDEATR